MPAPSVWNESPNQPSRRRIGPVSTKRELDPFAREHDLGAGEQAALAAQPIALGGQPEAMLARQGTDDAGNDAEQDGETPAPHRWPGVNPVGEICSTAPIQRAGS